MIDWDNLAENEGNFIGRISATQSEATSSESFQFWLRPGVLVNPFDIVSVGNVTGYGQQESRTIAMVTRLEHRTDAASHLGNFISNHMGELDEEPNTERLGVTVAYAEVLNNNADTPVFMPVPNNHKVQFATGQEIHGALGIDVLMQNRPWDAIPIGIHTQSNGEAVPIYVDRLYVDGTLGGHTNTSGMSGLAAKTSQMMFFVNAILQTSRTHENIAVIMLNVKHANLLQIHLPNPDLTEEDKADWAVLGIKPNPFENVHYYLPRNHRGEANSHPASKEHPVPPNSQIYAYSLEDTADMIDLLFSRAPDKSGTIAGICDEIKSAMMSKDTTLGRADSWDTLYKTLRDEKTIGDFKGASIQMFRRLIKRVTDTGQTGIFVGSRSGSEVSLSKELANIQGGHFYVPDVANLKYDEQTLVFGNILRTIYSLKAKTCDIRTIDAPVPEYIFIVVDELNKQAPADGKESAITDQILEVAEQGRSHHLILISAQQSRSDVNNRITGNCSTKLVGRTGAAELSKPEYQDLGDKDIRASATRLKQGEMLVTHPHYRKTFKIRFPKPAYRQPD